MSAELPLPQKQAHLREILLACGPVLVAYSGGVDSALLAHAAWQALDRRMLAIIADSPSLPRRHLRDALALAEAHGFPCRVLVTSELENPEYRRNGADRCYFCKDELFHVMERELVRRPEFRTLAYGLNADDLSDFRPGRAAAEAHGVRAPLQEAALGKAEVRELARQAGLAVWDRPASACLSSRIAPGIAVTPEVLGRIEQGEEALEQLGFRQFRLRYHGDLVRLEIAPGELPRALDLEMIARIRTALRPLGFRYVTLDLEGYRQGAMNPAVEIQLRPVLK